MGLDSFFKIKERKSSVGTEVLGGTTTYLGLVYIAFVQPVILSAAGMDFGAVLTATCMSSALACLIMGLFANYPIALAPAMGHNFYFTYAVVLGLGIAWQQALGAVLAAGLIFFALSLTNLRQKLIDSIPASLAGAIGCGIGLLISFVGFKWGGIIVSKPGTYVGLGDLTSGPVLLALGGLAIICVLLVQGFRSAILLGVLATAGMGLAAGIVEYHGLLSMPPSVLPTFMHLDLSGLLNADLLIVVGIFLFLEVFDTMGTLIGIAPEAGLMRNGKIDINKNAFLADASGTIVGSCMGTSTIACYVESSAGILAGARTGLAALTTGALLLITPFFYPLVKTVGGGVAVSEKLTLYPVTAPALIVIGIMMMKAVSRVNWKDYSDAVPAFLTIVVMQLSVSITDGIAFGFISYSLLSLFNGRFRRTSPIIHACSALLLIRYAFFV
ncbi:MAG: NCS2 family permease [Desulfonatronovibrionaceae bacterium]